MLNNDFLGFGNIMMLSDDQSRSISAENVYGDKGKGGMAIHGEVQDEVKRIGQHPAPNQPCRELGKNGQGWKVRPCTTIPSRSTSTLMDIDGPGIIRHMWFTAWEHLYRDVILRIYWDNEETPSVEAPLGDFFCNGFRKRANVTSLPINVNPQGGFNCYFPMPFREHARMTVENRGPKEADGFFYTINYVLTEVNPKAGYFHAQFRRTNPVPYGEDYTILDGVKGKGHYVGTYLGWQQNNSGWWGEGELKMFIDGDTDFPTICNTGTEDYFGGAWGFSQNYSAPFLGYPIGASDNKPGNRHGLYRFHILDPIHFHQDLRVTIQALGIRSNIRYLPLQDDICSVAYWYQAEPHGGFAKLGDRDALEVI